MKDYSVLMSIYCKENPAFVKLAIDSMVNQTIKPEQVVIVKDGKLSQELNCVIDEYKKNDSDLFTLIQLKENRGLGLALDEGMKYCRNELIARMDSDDISVVDRCEKQLYLFEKNPELDIVSGAIKEFKNDINNIVSTRRVPEYQEAIEIQMRRRSAFNHPAVMYKKSAVLRCGGYGNSVRKEDHDLFSRMLNQGCKAYNIQEAILYYRTGDESIKRRKSWKNVSSYIEIMWINLRRGYCNLGDFLFVMAAQIFYLVAPVAVIEKILKKFYRK